MEDKRIQISFKLNPEVEEDQLVLWVLSDQDNRQGFIKSLILDYYYEKKDLKDSIAKGAKFVNAPAVKSGRIITGRSAGHAVTFALEILKAVKGEAAAEKVRYALMLDTK